MASGSILLAKSEDVVYYPILTMSSSMLLPEIRMTLLFSTFIRVIRHRRMSNFQSLRCWSGYPFFSCFSFSYRLSTPLAHCLLSRLVGFTFLLLSWKLCCSVMKVKRFELILAFNRPFLLVRLRLSMFRLRLLKVACIFVRLEICSLYDDCRLW